MWAEFFSARNVCRFFIRTVFVRILVSDFHDCAADLTGFFTGRVSFSGHNSLPTWLFRYAQAGPFFIPPFFTFLADRAFPEYYPSYSSIGFVDMRHACETGMAYNHLHVSKEGGMPFSRNSFGHIC